MSEKQDKIVNKGHVLGHVMLTAPGCRSCPLPYLQEENRGREPPGGCSQPLLSIALSSLYAEGGTFKTGSVRPKPLGNGFWFSQVVPMKLFSNIYFFDPQT